MTSRSPLALRRARDQLRSHRSGTVWCHLARAGATLSPSLSRCQMPKAAGMGCFLRAGCSSLACPVSGIAYWEGHIQSHLQEEGGTRSMWMPKGNRQPPYPVCVSRMGPEVQSGSPVVGVNHLEHFLTLTTREVHGNSTNTFLQNHPNHPGTASGIHPAKLQENRLRDALSPSAL